MNSWKTFSASCWLWKRSPCKKLSRCLKKWWLARGQVNMVNEAKLHRLVCSAFEVLLVQWLGVAVEKNWALSVDRCWLQMLEFFVHLVDLLSKLLRCNGLTGIQKAVVGQTGSRPPGSMTFFFGASSALGSALELLLHPAAELVIVSCIKSTFCCSSQYDREMVRCCIVWENTSEQWYFLFFVRSWGSHSSSFLPFQFASNA